MKHHQASHNKSYVKSYSFTNLQPSCSILFGKCHWSLSRRRRRRFHNCLARKPWRLKAISYETCVTKYSITYLANSVTLFENIFESTMNDEWSFLIFNATFQAYGVDQSNMMCKWLLWNGARKYVIGARLLELWAYKRGCSKKRPRFVLRIVTCALHIHLCFAKWTTRTDGTTEK